MSDPTGAEVEERKARRDIGALLTRNVVSHGLSVVRQFVVLPLVTPSQLAVFKFLSNLTSYSRLFHFGALGAFRVRYPEWEAARDEPACARLQYLAWRRCLLGTLVFLPVLALFARNVPLHPVVLAAAILLGAAPLLADYAAASFQVRGEFRELSKLEVYSTTLGFVLVVGCTYLFGLPGLVLSSLGSASLRLVFARRHLFPSRSLPSRSERRSWSRFGARVWAGSAATSLANQGDILLLGLIIGESNPSLGFYALALTLVQFLAQDVRAVTIVLQRLIMRAVGSAGGVANPEVRQLTLSYLAIDSFVAAALAGVTMAAGAVALPLLFPKYADALIPLGPLLLSTVLIKARRYSTTILNQSDSVGLIVASSLSQLALTGAGFIVVHIFMGDVLIAYAIARLAGNSIAIAMEWFFACSVMEATSMAWSIVGRLLLSSAPCFALLLGLPLMTDSSWLLAIGGGASIILCSGTYAVFFFGAPAKAADLLLQPLLRKLRSRGSSGHGK